MCVNIAFTREQIAEKLDAALERFRDADAYLLENNLNERCIAGRIAFHLQQEITNFAVDVEYNRDRDEPKRMGLPEECANRANLNGQNRLVIPDIIVHTRGGLGPNILAVEIKKTSNPDGTDCDRKRLIAYRDVFKYQHCALILCQTRSSTPTISFEFVG